MATREEKQLIIDELTDKFEKAEAVYLTDFTGLNVQEMTELRKRFREACDPDSDMVVEFKVVKNTLAGLATEKAGLTKLKEYLTGPTAIAIGINTISSPAKLLLDYANEIKKGSDKQLLKIKVGLVEDEIISGDRAVDIAKLPSKEVLLSQVVRGFQSPISGFVGVLSGTVRKLVNVLNSIKEEKEKQE